VRFWNNDVLKNTEGVVERIRYEIGSRNPLNPPYPKGEI